MIIEDSGKIIPVSIAILLAKFTKNIVLVFIFEDKVLLIINIQSIWTKSILAMRKNRNKHQFVTIFISYTFVAFCKLLTIRDLLGSLISCCNAFDYQPFS